MGKKPFINKKKAATFTLVYRDSLNEADGADAGGDKVFTRIDGGTSHVPGFSHDDPWSRLPVEERGRPSVPPGRRAPQPREGDGDWDEWDGEEEEGWELESGEGPGGRGHLSLQNFEETMLGIGGPPFSSDRTQNRVSEHTRKEIVEMGFPDDGYNYMQHLRQIGGRVGSAFIPAPKPKLSLRPDVQAFDARKARLAAASREQIEGEDAMADMPPKEVYRGVRPIQQRGQRPLGLDPDIAKALEESDGSECEDGDMLEDDFVILANEEAGPSGEGGSASRQDETWLGNQEDGVTELEVKRRGGILDADVDDDVWGSDDEEGRRAVGRHKKGQDVSGDASGLETRSFRKGTSSVGTRELERSARLIDEQFENLALAEYGDEDEWGELDENDPDAHGHRDIEDFSDILDQFLEENKPHMNPHVYVSAAEEGRSAAAAAKPQTTGIGSSSQVESEQPLQEGKKEVELEGAEEEDEEAMTSEEEKEEAVVVEVAAEELEGWDCESIVSTYSNLENHPARIGAPSRRKKQELAPVAEGRGSAGGAIIRLGGRDKLPVDYLPPRPALSGKANGATAIGKMQETGGEVKGGKKGGPRGGETPAERKARKVAVKEERREARASKKVVKTMYRSEAKLAQQVVALTSVQGIHLP